MYFKNVSQKHKKTSCKESVKFASMSYRNKYEKKHQNIVSKHMFNKI